MVQPLSLKVNRKRKVEEEKRTGCSEVSEKKAPRLDCPDSENQASKDESVVTPSKVASVSLANKERIDVFTTCFIKKYAVKNKRETMDDFSKWFCLTGRHFNYPLDFLKIDWPVKTKKVEMKVVHFFQRLLYHMQCDVFKNPKVCLFFGVLKDGDLSAGWDKWHQPYNTSCIALERHGSKYLFIAQRSYSTVETSSIRRIIIMDSTERDDNNTSYKVGLIQLEKMITKETMIPTDLQKVKFVVCRNAKIKEEHDSGAAVIYFLEQFFSKSLDWLEYSDEQLLDMDFPDIQTVATGDFMKNAHREACNNYRLAEFVPNAYNSDEEEVGSIVQLQQWREDGQLKRKRSKIMTRCPHCYYSDTNVLRS